MPSLNPFAVFALVTSVLATSAHAAVPHTFQAGQPARAAEVNANFKSLDERMSAVEKNGAAYPDDHHPISYSRKELPVGSVITVGDLQYKIIRAPVSLPGEGVFAITLPVVVRTGDEEIAGDANSYVSHYINVRHRENFVYAPDNAVIDGYPARVSFSDSWTVAFGGVRERRDGVYAYYDQSYVATRSGSSSVDIEIGSYRLNLQLLSEREEQVRRDGIERTKSDFTDSVSLDAIEDAGLHSDADHLVDYIRVERLQ